jgi:molecular chaperone GrpE
MSGAPKKSGGKPKKEEEALLEPLEEGSELSLPANPELEEALREAAESVDEPREVDLVEPADAESYDEELDRLRKELIESRDKQVRLQADLENFRRRAQKEKVELIQFGHENLVKDLLSTVDNLDRAIDHARKSEGGDLESLLQGVELLQREFHGILGQHEVSEVEAQGATFDPAFHEAMAQVCDDSVPAGTVIEVLQKGYQLRGRMLRPARVIVAKEFDEKDEEAGEEAG